MKSDIKKLALGAALGLAISGQACALGFEVWMSDQGTTHDSATAPATGNLNSPTTTSGGYMRVYAGFDLMTGAATATPTNYHINGEGVVGGDLAMFKHTQFGNAANWSKPSAHGASVPKMRGIHGMLPSPNHRYLAGAVLNGFVAIVNAQQKRPVALFRVTGTDTAPGGNPHMAFFTADGKYLLVANQNARLLERIDLTWDASGLSLTNANYNRNATLDLAGTAAGGVPNIDGDVVVTSASGRLRRTADALSVSTIDASAVGANVGTASGTYQNDGFVATLPDNLTLKQTTTSGTRPNNSVICPIALDDNKHTLVTMAGGGAFIVDHTATPMHIVAAYDKTKIADAGCGGMENAGYMYFDQGTSVAPTSAPWSCAAGQATDRFAVYRLPSTGWPSAPSYLANPPAPVTMDNVGGSACTTTALARDAHGMSWGDWARNYLHVWDRFQNQVRVYKMPLGQLVNIVTYGTNSSGASYAANNATTCTDPTPDLGDYVFVPGATNSGVLKPRTYMALRGSGPLSFGHAASGSCGGFGVFSMDNGGFTTTLEYVNPTTIPEVSTDINGGLTNRSNGTRNATDPHAVVVRIQGS
jgi:hypothetical protein